MNPLQQNWAHQQYSWIFLFPKSVYICCFGCEIHKWYKLGCWFWDKLEIKIFNPPPLIFSQNPGPLLTPVLCYVFPAVPDCLLRVSLKTVHNRHIRAVLAVKTSTISPKLGPKGSSLHPKIFRCSLQPTCSLSKCPLSRFRSEETANFAKRNTDKIFIKKIQCPRQLLSKGDLCYYKYNLQDYIFLIISS